MKEEVIQGDCLQVMKDIPDMFRYEIIWEKDYPTNPYIAKKQVMKRHENILVFYKNQCTFKPQIDISMKKNLKTL